MDARNPACPHGDSPCVRRDVTCKNGTPWAGRNDAERSSRRFKTGAALHGPGEFDSFRLREPSVIRTPDGLVRRYGSARVVGGAWLSRAEPSRLSAMMHQIASTSPNGQVPARNPYVLERRTPKRRRG